MTSTTTKPDSSQPAAETAVDLFDNWFDPLETELRARTCGFIEELICGELDAVLARPRYRPSQVTGNEAKAGVAGHRHGSRKRTLTGTFGPVEIAVPRARLGSFPAKTSCAPCRVARPALRTCRAATDGLTGRVQNPPSLDLPQIGDARIG
jgi:putative transposase